MENITTKVILKIVNKLVYKTINRYSEHDHLPPVLRKEDGPAVRTTMAHFTDYDPLGMIRNYNFKSIGRYKIGVEKSGKVLGT